MNNNIIGIIVGVILTLLIGLYAGVSASEGMETPLMIIGVIVGIIVLTAMKDKVWLLLFAAPFISIRIPGLASFHFFEIALGAVLPFYLFNVFLGRSKLSWAPNKWLDFWVFVFLGLTIALMIRYPVGLKIVEGSEYLNSRAYFDILMAIGFYILLSTVKTNFPLIKTACYITVGMSLLAALYTIVTGILRPDMLQEVGSSRIGAFMPLGIWLVIFCIARYSLWDFVKKPWMALVVLIGLAGIGLSGFRSRIAGLAFIFLNVSIAVRRYLDAVLAPVVFIGVLLLVSMVFGAKNMPNTVQRSISFIPFIEVKPEIKKAAEDSTQWRLDMWEYAMDKNKAYIIDRVWGDGFALERAEFIRLNFHAHADNREEFAARGLWHSGPISTIHRYGYVGFTVVSMILLGAGYYGFLLCRIYYREKWGWTVLMLMGQVAAVPWGWYLLYGDITDFYGTIIMLPIAKLLLKAAKDEGIYKPVSIHRNYVPLMMRKEQEPTPTPGL